VSGLAITAAGLVATALALRHVGGDAAAWAAAGPLLVAGLGAGMVSSPNITLTLQYIPVRMAGAAAGALQTAQRTGAAMGTAVLATVFYQELTRSGRNYPTTVYDALLCASGLMVLALVVAIAEFRADLLRRLGRHREAATAYRTALDLADNEAEREFLAARLAAAEPLHDDGDVPSAAQAAP
jgi:hypothetical protein